MGMHQEQRKELEKIEQRSKRLRAAVEEWVNLIDETLDTMPEHSGSEVVTTLRLPPNGSKRSH
jgi:hypothetical protein